MPGGGWERVWVHRRYCGMGAGCGLRSGVLRETVLGVVDSEHPPRRMCQARQKAGTRRVCITWSGAVTWKPLGARSPGWVLGAVLDETTDYCEDMDERSMGRSSDFESTWTKPRPTRAGSTCTEGHYRDGDHTTAKTASRGPRARRPHPRRGQLAVPAASGRDGPALFRDRPAPSASLLWRARGNPEMAAELIRLGAPFRDSIVVDRPPRYWRLCVPTPGSRCWPTRSTRPSGRLRPIANGRSPRRPSSSTYC